MSPESGFSVDEEALRQFVLKAYHDKENQSTASVQLIGALRAFLSGPAGGPSVPGRYYFENDPDEALAGFVRDLEAGCPGLTRLVFNPILEALSQREKSRPFELAPNVAVYVASLAGPIALRSGLDETIVCALVAAAVLSLARLGGETVEKHLPV